MNKANEILARRLREMDAEDERIIKETFIETRNMDVVVERLRASRRGGARQGAGRKLGSGQGRKASARLEFNVTDDFKEAFEARAKSEGVTKVELLQRIFRAYK